MPFFTGDVYWEGPVEEFSGTELSTGEEAKLFKLKHESIEITLSEFGATLVSLKFNGKEMTLNYSTLSELEKSRSYYGATIGRYANRIKDSSFEVETGKEIRVKPNDGTHCLHGGPEGWSHRVWRGSQIDSNAVQFVLEDNDDSFGARVIARTCYSVEKASMNITWECILAPHEKRSTIINMTNHTYWNLSGDLFMKIHNHTLFLNCKRYLDLDSSGIPTGKIRNSSDGTIDDFHHCARTLWNNQYDHCYLKDPEEETLYAELNSDLHNLRLQIFSDQPAIQVYTANFLPEKDEAAPHDYQRAVCLEPQLCPDSPNHPHTFPSGYILSPSQPRYHRRASYVFSHHRSGPRAHCYCRICGRDWG